MDTSHYKTAFLLLTNNLSLTTLEHFEEIQKGCLSQGDAYILYHKKDDNFNTTFDIKNIPFFTFTDDVLFGKGYTPIAPSLIPGSNHFPILEFFKQYPKYEYYWVIEDDMRYNGKWEIFFSTFSNEKMNADFISSYIKRYNPEDQSWYWWQSLAHSKYFIPYERRIRSFNPIYRISNPALEFIDDILLKKWIGHHEVLIPTFLALAGSKLVDFGGIGEFVSEGFDNKFYTESSVDKDTQFLNLGTLRFRPIMKKVGDLKDKLYHPVKLERF